MADHELTTLLGDGPPFSHDAAPLLQDLHRGCAKVAAVVAQELVRRLEQAIQDALVCLGSGQCDIPHCPGCVADSKDAIAVLKEALGDG